MLQYRLLKYPVLLVIFILVPLVFSDPYTRRLLIVWEIYALLALSLDIIMGRMGQFSFGHAAFFGIGAFTTALLTARMGMPVWVGWIAAVAAGGAAGWVIGFVSLRRTRGMFLGIVTLGFATVIQQVFINIFAEGGVWGIPPGAIGGINLREAIPYYYLLLFFIVLTIYLINRLMRSRFGRAISALRENETLASSIGINASKYYVLAFMLGTALAGLAGAMYAHKIGVVTPSLLGLQYMFLMLIMVIVGGRGTLAGPIVGAGIVVFGPELLRATAEYSQLAFGLILLVCILFMRQGIYPAAVSLWNRFIANRIFPKIRPRRELAE